jgi:hypothetical protein
MSPPLPPKSGLYYPLGGECAPLLFVVYVLDHRVFRLSWKIGSLDTLVHFPKHPLDVKIGFGCQNKAEGALQRLSRQNFDIIFRFETRAILVSKIWFLERLLDLILYLCNQKR